MKRIKMLRVLLSQEEYEDLLRRAGDVPISRYVRRVLSGSAEPLIVDRAVDAELLKDAPVREVAA